MTTEHPIPDDDRADTWKERVVRRSLEEAKRRSLDRSQAFVSAAIGLAEESGDAFTVQDVCDAAGFSMRLFYQYFAGKDDLMIAVLEEVVREYVERGRAHVRDDADPVVNLTSHLERSVMPRSDPVADVLVRHAVELTRTRPEALAQVNRPQVELLSELITKCVDAGSLPPGDSAKRAYCVSILRSTYNQSRLLGNDVGLELPSPADFATFCFRAIHSV